MEGQSLAAVLKQRRGSEESVTYTTAETECGLREAEGVLVSRTRHYYLVKGQGVWVPVRLCDLYDSEGEKVAKERPFEQLKTALVRIKYCAGIAKAYILPEGTEKMQSLRFDTRPSSTSPPPLRGLLSLTSALSRDITAMSLVQSVTPAALPRMMETARLRLIQKLPAAVQELEPLDSPKAQQACTSLKHCLQNLVLSDSRVVCDDCKVGKSVFMISCGHRVCSLCLKKKKASCGVCRLKYTKTDLKLTAALMK